MNRNILALLFIPVFIWSCKKDPLPVLPDENTPYYSIRGLVNSDSINWNVGLADVNLEHGVSEINGVQTFYGQINSPESQMAVKIEVVKPEKIFNGTGIDVVSPAGMGYLVHQPGAVKFNFGINYSQLNYMLVKNEENVFTVMNHINFNAFGIYNTVIKFTDFGSDSYVIPIKYGFEDQKIDPKFTSSASLGDSVVSVVANNSSGNHKWYLDGDLVSEQSSFTFDLVDGIYTVKHELTDVNFNKAEYTTLIRIKGGVYYWQLKYDYVWPAQPSSNYGTVLISVLKDGVWYSSALGVSNLTKVFSAFDVETVVDGNLKPMWSIFDFSFGAVLYNENQTDSLHLSDMIGTFNVALK